MSADDSNAGSNGVDEQRRKVLKLTLASGAAFATPLMVSFSLDGLGLGGEGAVAQTYLCNQGVFSPATAELDSNGNLSVTVSVESCAGETLFIEVSADAEVVWRCRNRDGEYPPGLDRFVEGRISGSVEITPHDDASTNVGLTLTPPMPGNFRCPPPLQPRVSEVAYFNIMGTIDGFPFSVVPAQLSATF